MSISISQYRSAIGQFATSVTLRHKGRANFKHHRYKPQLNRSKKYGKNINTTHYLLILFIIICNTSYEHLLQVQCNKNAHCTYGNIKINHLKIFHWNKGNSLFSNEIDDIHILLDKFQPHIFSISEANYNNDTQYNLGNYNIETSDLGIDYKNSRQILLIHKSVQYKRMKEYDHKYISAIVINIRLRNNKSTNLVSSIDNGSYQQTYQYMAMTTMTNFLGIYHLLTCAKKS